MAGRPRIKDHLQDHGRLELVKVLVPPPHDDDDPLRWWTQHPQDPTEVDLHEFAEGQVENPYGTRPLGRNWAGPFTGRPELIRELASQVRDRTLLSSSGTVKRLCYVLRSWWRLFDALESTLLPGGKRRPRVVSVANLDVFHEAAAHQRGMPSEVFSCFRTMANEVRKALGLPELHWIAPEAPVPERQLISDDMAKVLRVALKRNWRAVRKRWQLRDQVRAEAGRRDQGEPPKDIGAEGERLLANWYAYQRAVHQTGKTLPSSLELRGGLTQPQCSRASLTLTDMRAMLFPTMWEADAAFHMALLDSAWNPSTLQNVDASDPYCVAPSLKDSDAHLVLHATEVHDTHAQGDDESGLLSVSAPKPRAGGKLQICEGLAKNSCSAPFVVRAFIERTELLREHLRAQLRDAIEEHGRFECSAADRETLTESFKLIQRLKRGIRSVWLYLNGDGSIYWISKDESRDRHKSMAQANKYISYLAKVVEQLAARGETVGHVTASDLRDLAARRYFQQTGSIIALMLKLGHSKLRTTSEYLDNQLFRAENDEVARRFLESLFGELAQGRVDLSILAQLSRHGPLSPEMQTRLIEYRSLMRSRLGVGCSEPRNPPEWVDPKHIPGKLCGSSRCTLPCPRAKFLPDSMDGIAMRAEELMAISDMIPREAWLRERFHEEQQVAEAMLDEYFPITEVASARAKWRANIAKGLHRIPGIALTLGRAKASP